MSIREFKKSMKLIASFVARLDELYIPYHAKKSLVKAYANTLRINLTDNMVESII